MDAARISGKEVQSETIAVFDNAEEAFAEEARQIAAYGRLPNGPLTNRSDGPGGSGVVWSTESRKKAADAKRGHTWNKGRPRPDFREKTRKDITAFRLDGTRVGSFETARLAEEATGVGFKKISVAAKGGVAATKSSTGELFQFRFGVIESDIDPAKYRSQKSRRK